MNNILDGISINYHASIKIVKNNINIYIDPFKIKENTKDADYIFITHSHYDHYSINDINKVINKNTIIIAPSSMKIDLTCFNNKIIYVIPDNYYELDDFSFHAVASYNINKKFHPKDNSWVGYNILINNIKYYVLGDCDVTKEVVDEECDVIFVPVGGTYTMDYKEASSFINNKNIKYAIPIHYDVVGGKDDAIHFVNLLNDNKKGVILR